MPANLQEQKYTGMFAMTERGHGSNVRGIQTEATFDFSAQVRVLSVAARPGQQHTCTELGSASV